jgi:hypothetical protein
MSTDPVLSYGTRQWTTRVARENGLAVGGENPGYGLPGQPERPLHKPVRRGHDGQRAAPGPFLQIQGLLLGPRRPPVGRNDSVYPVRRDDRRSGGQAGGRVRVAPSVLKKRSLRQNGPWYHRSGTLTSGGRRDGGRADPAAGRPKRHRAGVLVISPHLDDAVLSCGALLAHLVPRHLITVATVFTAAAPPPWSLPARHRAGRRGERPGEPDRPARRGRNDPRPPRRRPPDYPASWGGRTVYYSDSPIR